jgi:hypothetical protein
MIIWGHSSKYIHWICCQCTEWAVLSWNIKVANLLPHASIQVISLASSEDTLYYIDTSHCIQKSIKVASWKTSSSFNHVLHRFWNTHLVSICDSKQSVWCPRICKERFFYFCIIQASKIVKV